MNQLKLKDCWGEGKKKEKEKEACFLVLQLRHVTLIHVPQGEELWR